VEKKNYYGNCGNGAIVIFLICSISKKEKTLLFCVVYNNCIDAISLEETVDATGKFHRCNC
jgi:hypothetical protein